MMIKVVLIASLGTKTLAPFAKRLKNKPEISNSVRRLLLVGRNSRLVIMVQKLGWSFIKIGC